MTRVAAIHCPEMEDLERAIIAGGLSGEMALHVAGCTSCREVEVMIRDNIEFMGGVREHLGDAVGRPTRPVLEPDVLPGYQLIREIARGGQGVVYEGVQIETKRRVAVKMIESSGPDGRGRRRIEREAELAASLRHPNIVSIYQRTTLPDGRHALAMEYVDGVGIDQWARAVDASAPQTKEGSRGAVRVKLRAVATVCDAVQHAHVNGVIHRDLKPANVLVVTSGVGGGVPRVVDFGIARRVDQGTRITRTGAFAGTLAYASPEQVSGDPTAVDTRADVYSLGLILYEVLTARRPYDTAGSLSGAIANITRAAPAPLEKVQPGDQIAGDELEAIVEKALAKNRSERYQSAAALKSDLESWMAGKPVQARQHSTVYMLRKLAARHRVGFAVAAGLIVVLAALAGVMAWSSGNLAKQKSLLAASLASSTIERGRLVGLSGENSRAEELIWPEAIGVGMNPSDGEACVSGSPEVMQAVWALFELYSRHPSLAHYRVLAGSEVMRFEDGDRAIRLIRPDGSQEVRSVEDGRVLNAVEGHTVATDARMLLDANRLRGLIPVDGGVAVIGAGSGAEHVFCDPRLKGRVVDMSLDGSRLLEVDERKLRLWRTQPLEVVAELAEEVSRQSRPRFSRDGKLVAAGVQDKARLWKAEDGSAAGEWRIPAALWASVAQAPINAIQMSPDSSMLAAGFHNTMLLFPLGEGLSEPKEIAAHRGFVSWLEFSGDGRTLLSMGSERSCKTWDAASGTLLGTFEQATPVRGVPTMSSDGKLAAVCDASDVIRVFECRPRRWLTQLKDAQNTIHCVKFSPDGSVIGAVSSDGAIRVWDSKTRSLAWRTQAGGPALEAMSFSPDGKRIAVAGRGGSIGVVDVGAPGEPRKLVGGVERITWLSYAPTGKVIATAGEGATISLFDAETGERAGELVGHTGRVIDAVFSRDGSVLVSVGADGVCTAWDVEGKTERFRTESVGAPMRAVSLSPDGMTIATGSDDWKIRVWSAKDGKLLRTIAGAKQHVFGLAFHPKGNVLFSCTRDSVVQAWDYRTGRELAALTGHRDLVLSMAISPDGWTLATGSADRTVGVWDLGYYRAHVKGNAGIWAAAK